MSFVVLISSTKRCHIMFPFYYPVNQEEFVAIMTGDT